MAAVVVPSMSWSPPRPRPRAVAPRLVAPSAGPRPRADAPRVSRRADVATYRRRRGAALLAVLGLSVVVLVAVSSVWGAVSSASAHGSAPVAPTESSAHLSVAAPASSYVVQSGDSLWTIARRLQPQGDVRPLVDQLSERNGGPSLRSGQRLDLHGLRY